MSENSIRSFQENVLPKQKRDTLLQDIITILVKEGPKACFEIEEQIDTDRPYDTLCFAKRTGLIVINGKKKNSAGRLVSVYQATSTLSKIESDEIRLKSILDKEESLEYLLDDLNAEYTYAKKLIAAGLSPFHKVYNDKYNSYGAIREILSRNPLIGYKDIKILLEELYARDIPEKNVGARVEEMKQMGHITSPTNDPTNSFELLDLSSRYIAQFVNNKYMENIAGRIERYTKTADFLKERKQEFLSSRNANQS
jgi:hypothetical protein